MKFLMGLAADHAFGFVLLILLGEWRLTVFLHMTAEKIYYGIFSPVSGSIFRDLDDYRIH